MKTGLDDFRDGFPPDEDEIIIKPKRGPSPIFTGLDDSTSSSNNSKASRSYNSRKLRCASIYFLVRRALIDPFNLMLDVIVPFLKGFSSNIKPRRNHLFVKNPKCGTKMEKSYSTRRKSSCSSFGSFS